MAYEIYSYIIINRKIEDALASFLVKDLIRLIIEYTIIEEFKPPIEELRPAQRAQLMQAIFATFLAKTLPYETVREKPSDFKLSNYSPTPNFLLVNVYKKRLLGRDIIEHFLCLNNIVKYSETPYPEPYSDGNFLDYMASQLEIIARGGSGLSSEASQEISFDTHDDYQWKSDRYLPLIDTEFSNMLPYRPLSICHVLLRNIEYDLYKNHEKDINDYLNVFRQYIETFSFFEHVGYLGAGLTTIPFTPSRKQSIREGYNKTIDASVTSEEKYFYYTNDEKSHEIAHALVKLGYRLPQIVDDVTREYSIGSEVSVAVMPDDMVKKLQSNFPAFKEQDLEIPFKKQILTFDDVHKKLKAYFKKNKLTTSRDDKIKFICYLIELLLYVYSTDELKSLSNYFDVNNKRAFARYLAHKNPNLLTVAQKIIASRITEVELMLVACGKIIDSWHAPRVATTPSEEVKASQNPQGFLPPPSSLSGTAGRPSTSRKIPILPYNEGPNRK